MSRDLIDPEDGENLAIRAFLQIYGNRGLLAGEMMRHLDRSGYPFWPEWVESQGHLFLTKSGAQAWLRHLFALEKP